MWDDIKKRTEHKEERVVHILVLLDFLVSYVYQIDNNGDKDDKACQNVHLVVFQPNAATPKQHVQWNEQLEQADQKPERNHIGRPKEKKGVEHV